MPLRSQKVIIPKGLVNPNETTIIEIPQKLQDRPAVVAKHKIRKSQLVIGDGEYIKPKKTGKEKKIEKVDTQLPLEVPYDDPKSDSFYKYRLQRGNSILYSRGSLDYFGNRLRDPQPTHNPSLPFKKTNSTTQATHDHQETDYYTQNGLNIRMGKLFANISRNNNNVPTPNNRNKTDVDSYPTDVNDHVPYTNTSNINELRQALDQMEIVELNRIQKDLKEFQIARRKLILDATNINT